MNFPEYTDGPTSTSSMTGILQTHPIANINQHDDNPPPPTLPLWTKKSSPLAALESKRQKIPSHNAQCHYQQGDN